MRTDLTNLGVAVVKELNELRRCQYIIGERLKLLRLTSSISEGILANYVIEVGIS